MATVINFDGCDDSITLPDGVTDFQIFDRVLTHEEIQELYKEGSK